MMKVSEAVAKRCCLKQVFLEISQNSQENTCGRVSFSMPLFLLISLQGQFQESNFLFSKSSRDLHCLRTLGKMFQTLVSTKDVVSMPYLTE